MRFNERADRGQRPGTAALSKSEPGRPTSETQFAYALRLVRERYLKRIADFQV